MLDKDEMVIERDFGGDIGHGRGNISSERSSEDGNRKQERDSAGSQGRLVPSNIDRVSEDSDERYEMTRYGGKGAQPEST
jgi:hypothetical protein